MDIIYINLAVEDSPSETILRKILNQLKRPYQVSNCLCQGGYGYLKKRIASFNQAAAKAMPFLILTDLNSSVCPPKMINSWLKGAPKHPNLLFRIAVKEVESWILAHREGIAAFLGISEKNVPMDTDSIPDPKAFLIKLAGKSRSRLLKEGLIPQPGATSRQGPNYNSRIINFIQENWDAGAASLHSKSLQRTLDRLKLFEPIGVSS